jgi:hypothetical protein
MQATYVPHGTHAYHGFQGRRLGSQTSFATTATGAASLLASDLSTSHMRHNTTLLYLHVAMLKPKLSALSSTLDIATRLSETDEQDDHQPGGQCLDVQAPLLVQ